MTTLGARHFFNIYQFESFAVRQGMRGALALVAAACLSAWLLCAVFSSPQPDRPGPVRAPIAVNLNSYFSFIDSRFESYFLPETFSESFTVRSGQHQASVATMQLTAPAKTDSATLPSASSPPLQHSASTPRSSPPRLAQDIAPGASTPNDEALANTPDDKKTIIEKFLAKLFGRPSSAQLAYAATDDGQLGDAGSLTASGYDQWTAVYDISAHAVYMPDGTKLEAHSGLGASLDDPAYVSEKDRGPTPPNIYNLELRGTPFHGVRALRLIPVDDQKALGRTGLLAHSFMLGPNGESYGCVSLRDYDAFLHAYMNHQIKRLVVVARLD